MTSEAIMTHSERTFPHRGLGRISLGTCEDRVQERLRASSMEPELCQGTSRRLHRGLLELLQELQLQQEWR